MNLDVNFSGWNKASAFQTQKHTGQMTWSYIWPMTFSPLCNWSTSLTSGIVSGVGASICFSPPHKFASHASPTTLFPSMPTNYYYLSILVLHTHSLVDLNPNLCLKLLTLTYKMFSKAVNIKQLIGRSYAIVTDSRRVLLITIATWPRWLNRVPAEKTDRQRERDQNR